MTWTKKKPTKGSRQSEIDNLKRSVITKALSAHFKPHSKLKIPNLNIKIPNKLHFLSEKTD